jgi:hypothetical protein
VVSRFGEFAAGVAAGDDCGADAEPAESGDFGFEEHPISANKTIASGRPIALALNV